VDRHVGQVVSSGRPVVSGLTIDPVTHKPTVVMAYPVSRPVAGVIDFDINLSDLQTLFAGIPLPGGSVITLTDRRGLVLARSRDADRFIGTTVDLAPLIGTGPEPRTPAGPDIDGVDRLFASAVAGRGAWVITVGIPASAVEARLRPLWWRNLIIVLVTLSGSCLLSWWIGGRLSRQERKMRGTFESLERQMVRQARVAAVGVLVSGIAHELNNRLQAILGSSELLERRLDLSSDALVEIGFIKTQSVRAREIIRNLSRFSTPYSGPPSAVDLHDIIAAATRLRRASLDAAGIVLDVEARSTRKVIANFTELEQVVLDFIINAQQAIEAAGMRHGRVVIRLLDVGKRVRLEVIDDGPGVSQDDEPKLFQAFFTTKPVGEGTGLGLSVSSGIVEAYGGTVGYHRNELGGATFFFELPALD
jgi:signal transduction histidine kinase